MYSTVPVPIPQREKGLSIKKIGNVRYVYFNTAYKYSAQTKKTSPQSKSIGKVIEGRPGMMYPNENFYRYFPEEAAEYLAPGDTSIDPACEARESSVRQLWEVKVGGTIVIDAVLKRLKLKPLIRHIFGKRTELFLDLLACCVLTEGRLDWNRYREEHVLFQKDTRVPSASDAAQFLRNIPEVDCKAFLDAWNRQRDHSHPVTVCCGSIGTPTEGIHYAVVWDNVSKRPVLYRYTPGRALDSSDLQETADLLRSHQYTGLCYLLDGDHASPEVIRAIAASGFPFLVQTDGMHPMVRNPLEDLRSTLEAALEYYEFMPGVFGASQWHRYWTEGQMECNVHILYQPQAAAHAREALSAAVSECEASLRQHIGRPICLELEFQRFFSLERDAEGNLLSFQRRDDVLQDVLEHSGFLVLVTDGRHNFQYAMNWYSCRDNGAPPFRLDGLFPAGSDFPRGGMLLSFAAQIVWDEIYTLLQPGKKASGLQFPGISPVSAGIAALENMTIVRNEAYQYQLATALKRAQKGAFAACGIAPDIAVQRAWEIGLQLQAAAVQPPSQVRRS